MRSGCTSKYTGAAIAFLASSYIRRTSVTSPIFNPCIVTSEPLETPRSEPGKYDTAMIVRVYEAASAGGLSGNRGKKNIFCGARGGAGAAGGPGDKVGGSRAVSPR